VGRFGGPSEPPWRGPYPVCLSEARLTLVFFAGFEWGFPSCLRGPLGLFPTLTYVVDWSKKTYAVDGCY
jgi:hypothetical protein